jgi:hypothetical protein
MVSIARSPPSISTKVPIGVSSSAMGGVFGRELLAKFLVAKPHVQAHRLEDARPGRRRR